jgi:rRNA maturation endonuclease Nob1
VQWLVLDTSLLLGGKDPPRGPRWATTPEAAAEVSAGGRDARRFEDWLSIGLDLREPHVASRSRVEAAAKAAGSLDRLSPADRSLLALALDLGSAGADDATLVTDDYTMLDVALRLGVKTQTVNQGGIRASLDFRPRCTGCGRWFEAPQKADMCPVCGSPVKPRPWKGRPTS